MKFLICFIYGFIIAEGFKISNNKNTKCGYAACPPVLPDVLNIHLVPHSHDDVGWLKTVDQYYYGARNNIQKAGVQYILDSVIEALLKNPERRFIYVETAFFWKWWLDRGEDMHEKVRYLVNNGQLEITGGAWSMNDEAAAHYQSTVDQFTWGFRKLEDNLESCARPRVAWQIDPFGHSREMASLFSQFGFDGLFFARLDWREKSARLKDKTAEMLWQGSQSLGNSSQLFTSILYNHYMPPPGFCFDVLCNDSPIVDDKNSPEYNAEAKAKEFLNFVWNQAKYYKTNHAIVTMGGDFTYQDALSHFTNLDKLIHAINKLGTNATAYYSTPACYLKAVNEADLTWPVKTDDFFPYASDPHTYWSGYFTSRPTSKRYERFGSNFLQVSKQLAVLSGEEDIATGLDPLREAIGVMQHHDAVTGTEKQHVADDYARLLTAAIKETGKVAERSLRKLVKQDAGLELKQFENCLLLNISKCDLTETSDEFYVTIYNPLSRMVSYPVRLPVSKQGYEVTDIEGAQITSQYVPLFEMIDNIPGRNSKATGELVFMADSIPPIGYKIYKVKYNQAKATSTETNNENLPKETFGSSGFLNEITINGKSINLSHNILYYEGALGNNEVFENRSSGAYIFRPTTPEPNNLSGTGSKINIEGPVVQEIHAKYNDWVGEIVRIYPNKDYVEINWIVGPIPVDDKKGKEIISRFSTSLESDKVFYTDANGREMIKRVRDSRETWNLTMEEPVAQNYYPVTAKISIRDEKQNVQFSVLNDRAQGGSSLRDGEIELMVHRRLLHDDAFGVGEALNEVAFGKGLVATGKHYLHFGSTNSDGELTASAKERLLAQEILLSPWIFVSSADKPEKPIVNKKQFSGITKSLPQNVHILTLEPWGPNTILLRLEHILEKDEDPNLSRPEKINIKDLFSQFRVVNVKEMTLGGNILASEMQRMKWKAEDNEIILDNLIKKENNENTLEVTLTPMQIKTFVINIEHNTK